MKFIKSCYFFIWSNEVILLRFEILKILEEGNVASRMEFSQQLSQCVISPGQAYLNFHSIKPCLKCFGYFETDNEIPEKVSFYPNKGGKAFFPISYD